MNRSHESTPVKVTVFQGDDVKSLHYGSVDHSGYIIIPGERSIVIDNFSESDIYQDDEKIVITDETEDIRYEIHFMPSQTMLKVFKIIPGDDSDIDEDEEDSTDIITYESDESGEIQDDDDIY